MVVGRLHDPKFCRNNGYQSLCVYARFAKLASYKKPTSFDNAQGPTKNRSPQNYCTAIYYMWVFGLHSGLSMATDILGKILSPEYTPGTNSSYSHGHPDSSRHADEPLPPPPLCDYLRFDYRRRFDSGKYRPVYWNSPHCRAAARNRGLARCCSNCYVLVSYRICLRLCRSLLTQLSRAVAQEKRRENFECVARIFEPKVDKVKGYT